MKRLLILATVVAMALAMVQVTAFAKNNSSGDKSTGGVGYTSGAGHDASASFNAHETPNNAASDAKGKVNFQGIGPDGDIDYKGTVDCYQRVDDDTARFSGVIDDSNDPAERGFFEVAVQDNGSPGRNGDMISQRLTASDSDCETSSLTPQAEVESGNLKVHH